MSGTNPENPSLKPSTSQKSITLEQILKAKHKAKNTDPDSEFGHMNTPPLILRPRRQKTNSK